MEKKEYENGALLQGPVEELEDLYNSEYWGTHAAPDRELLKISDNSVWFDLLPTDAGYSLGWAAFKFWRFLRAHPNCKLYIYYISPADLWWGWKEESDPQEYIKLKNLIFKSKP